MVRFFRKNILSTNNLCTEKYFKATLLCMEKMAGELILCIILSI